MMPSLVPNTAVQGDAPRLPLENAAGSNQIHSSTHHPINPHLMMTLNQHAPDLDTAYRKPASNNASNLFGGSKMLLSSGISNAEFQQEIGPADSKAVHRARQRYPWLLIYGNPCHSDRQMSASLISSMSGNPTPIMTSGNHSSKRKYRRMYCHDCAIYNPLTPWASMKARKFETETLTDHEKSVHHLKALANKEQYTKFGAGTYRQREDQLLVKATSAVIPNVSGTVPAMPSFPTSLDLSQPLLLQQHARSVPPPQPQAQAQPPQPLTNPLLALSQAAAANRQDGQFPPENYSMNAAAAWLAQSAFFAQLGDPMMMAAHFAMLNSAMQFGHPSFDANTLAQFNQQFQVPHLPAQLGSLYGHGVNNANANANPALHPGAPYGMPSGLSGTPYSLAAPVVPTPVSPLKTNPLAQQPHSFMQDSSNIFANNAFASMTGHSILGQQQTQRNSASNEPSSSRTMQATATAAAATLTNLKKQSHSSSATTDAPQEMAGAESNISSQKRSIAEAQSSRPEKMRRVDSGSALEDQESNGEEDDDDDNERQGAEDEDEDEDVHSGQVDDEEGDHGEVEDGEEDMAEAVSAQYRPSKPREILLQPDWLEVRGKLRHSDPQQQKRGTSTATTSTSIADGKNTKKKYKECFCRYCAEFQPGTPWSVPKGRKYEMSVLRLHERSLSHRRAEEMYLAAQASLQRAEQSRVQHQQRLLRQQQQQQLQQQQQQQQLQAQKRQARK